MHSGQVTFAGIGDPPVGVGPVECSRGADEADDRRTCRRSAAKRGGPEAALGRRGGTSRSTRWRGWREWRTPCISLRGCQRPPEVGRSGFYLPAGTHEMCVWTQNYFKKNVFRNNFGS